MTNQVTIKIQIKYMKRMIFCMAVIVSEGETEVEGQYGLHRPG